MAKVPPTPFPLSQSRTLSSQLFSNLRETTHKAVQPLKKNRWAIAKFGALAALAIVPLFFFPGGGIPINIKSSDPTMPNQPGSPLPMCDNAANSSLTGTNTQKPSGADPVFPSLQRPLPFRQNSSSSYEQLLTTEYPLEKREILKEVLRSALHNATSISEKSKKSKGIENLGNLTDYYHYSFSTITNPFSLQTEKEVNLFEKDLFADLFLKLEDQVLKLGNQAISQTRKVLNTLSDGTGWWLLKELAASKIANGHRAIPSVFDQSRKDFFPSGFSAFLTVTDTAVNSIDNAFALGSFADRLLTPLVSYTQLGRDTLFMRRITVDTLLLGRQMQNHYQILRKSGQHLSAKRHGLGTTMQHAFAGLASVHGVLTTFIQGWNLGQGAWMLTKKDDTQKEAILKHRAIHLINPPKPCNAVIIDGLSNEWGRINDNIPSPTAEFFYKKCNTQTYRVTSDQDICRVLKQATEHFAAPIETLSIEGHANGNLMVLNAGYDFKGDETALKCLDESIKPDADIFLLGCNTATRDHGPDKPSLTERISQRLPTRKVTGTTAYLNPFITSNSFSDGTFSMSAFCPKDSNGNWVLKNSVVSFQNGKQL